MISARRAGRFHFCVHPSVAACRHASADADADADADEYGLGLDVCFERPQSKPPELTKSARAGAWDISLTMSYFHTGTRTIIGAEAFHCPVRDGKEWDHLAMVIRLNWSPGCCLEQPSQFMEIRIDIMTACSRKGKPRVFDGLMSIHRQSYRVKPHGQLVSVSLTHYCASTPDLSTSWSRTTLQGAQGPGKTHLETSFPLRCFQRLSLPHIATRQCHWRDNRYTRGASTPVLSY